MVERQLPMAMLLCRLAEGNLVEMFATGTAATIVPVDSLLYRGEVHAIPLGGPAGVAATLKKEMDEVQRGEVVR